MQCVSIGCKKEIPKTKSHYKVYGKYCQDCCSSSTLNRKSFIAKKMLHGTEKELKIIEEMYDL